MEEQGLRKSGLCNVVGCPKHQNFSPLWNSCLIFNSQEHFGNLRAGEHIYLGVDIGCPLAHLREIYQSAGHLDHLVSRNLM